MLLTSSFKKKFVASKLQMTKRAFFISLIFNSYKSEHGIFKDANSYLKSLKAFENQNFFWQKWFC